MRPEFLKQKSLRKHLIGGPPAKLKTWTAPLRKSVGVFISQKTITEWKSKAN